MRRSVAAVLAAAVLVLTGCHADVPSPGQAKIDVDTPQLRQLKAAAGIEACRPGTGAAVDGGLPDVTLPCLGGGKSVDLASLRGPLIVNVWASWCGPCRREMPALGEFYRKYGDRVPVIGIDYNDEQTGPAIELAQKSGVTYPLLADAQDELPAKSPFPARMLVPSFVFVRADGTVATPVPGGIDSVAELVDLVNQNLGTDL